MMQFSTNIPHKDYHTVKDHSHQESVKVGSHSHQPGPITRTKLFRSVGEWCMIPLDIYISLIYIWMELYRLCKHSFHFLFPQFSIARLRLVTLYILLLYVCSFHSVYLATTRLVRLYMIVLHWVTEQLLVTTGYEPSSLTKSNRP